MGRGLGQSPIRFTPFLPTKILESPIFPMWTRNLDGSSFDSTSERIAVIGLAGDKPLRLALGVTWPPRGTRNC